MTQKTVTITKETLKKPHLLIDTANETLSLALIADGTILAEFSEQVFREMAARLQPELQNLLQQAQLSWPEIDGILLNTGPGSFTSIRIGLAAAKALELSLGVKLYGLNGLQALAQPHLGQAYPVTVMLEAVGQDVYTQSFAPTGEPLAEAVTQTLPEAQNSAPEGALFVGNVAGVETRKTTAGPMAFWALFENGFATMPPKPAYVRPLTYKKVAQG
jgi:tRNA threonylcarbamoyladenosine biosynthesis protein TsaB